jgi:hypothetical protein
MNSITYELDPPFKFLYEDGESQVLIQIKTADLSDIVPKIFGFLTACGYKEEEILEAVSALLNQE